MAHAWMRFTLLALATAFLTGCGGRSTSIPKAAPTLPPAPTATHAPSPTVAAQPATPTVALASPAAPTVASLAPTATKASPAVVTGVTEDGHHFWGAPDAPVTMIDFSDFM